MELEELFEAKGEAYVREIQTCSRVCVAYTELGVCVCMMHVYMCASLCVHEQMSSVHVFVYTYMFVQGANSEIGEWRGVQGPDARWPCKQCFVLVTRTMNNLWPFSMFICMDVLLLYVLIL